MNFSGRTIAVGVTGGIAAYKTCALVSLLKKAGADVYVAMTENAARFVSKLTFETLSGHRVVTDMWARDFEWEVEHISFAQRADIFVVAPCTLNMAGKLAAGIADDFLSTTLFAARCPVLLAPAMNTAMLESAAYKANEQILKDRGYAFIYGGAGRLACGDVGAGRMAEPEEIAARLYEMLYPKRDFAGKTVLVTAGATQEALDPVRYITNRSSGKMGCALADAAARRGARVVLVAGHMRVQPQESVERVDVSTTQEMYDAVLSRVPACDYIIKAAAPADYRAEQAAKNKIKDASLTLKLVKNPDIAAAVGACKGGAKLAVFAAETENLVENAQIKLRKKNADLVVANDVTKEGAGFDADTNIAVLVTAAGARPLPCMAKSALADVILDTLAAL